MKFGANENYFDLVVWDAAQRHRLGGWDAAATAALIKAHIAQETQPPFNDRSFRQEPGGNASIGLMQILLSNAPDLTMQQLFDPPTNIDRGAAIIEQNWRISNGDLDAAISAYNGGWSKKSAMGYRATTPLTVCLARDTRGNCIKTRAVKVGEFGNQPYVDSVKSNFGYFLQQPLQTQEGPIYVAGQAPSQLPQSQQPITLRQGPIQFAQAQPMATAAIGGGLILGLLALGYFLLRGH